MKRLLTCVLACALLGCPPNSPALANPPDNKPVLTPAELRDAQENLKKREAEYFRILHERINGGQEMTVTTQGVGYPVFWESLPSPDNVVRVYRTRTPEGWIVIIRNASDSIHSSTSAIYIPDKTASWMCDLNKNLPEKQ